MILVLYSWTCVGSLHLADAAELRSFKCYYLICPTSLLGVLYILQQLAKVVLGQAKCYDQYTMGRAETHRRLAQASLTLRSQLVLKLRPEAVVGGKSLRLHCNPITLLNLT